MIVQQRGVLRRRILEIQRRKPASRRYPEELRRAVHAYMRDGRGAGHQHKATCRALALSAATVKRWSASFVAEQMPQNQAQRFRPVVMALATRARETDSGPATSFCSLTSPTGYRVEGLSIEQVLCLLRELR